MHLEHPCTKCPAPEEGFTLYENLFDAKIGKLTHVFVKLNDKKEIAEKKTVDCPHPEASE